jgi:hypothetical protein
MRLFVCLLAAACVLLVAVPHHREGSESFRANTLLGIYRKSFADIPTRWNVERATLLAILLLGAFASLFPLLLIAMIYWHRPAVGAAGGALFCVVALPALLGGLANAFLILINQMSFGFGGRPTPRDAIAFSIMLMIMQASLALVSLAIGVSARVASAFH